MRKNQNVSASEGEAPRDVLNRVFGYEDFRLDQAEVIDAVVRGEDTFVLMPTGGGKSLCYQIPGLVRKGVAIVVSPLIALMKNQVDALQAKGVRAEYISSQLPPQKHREIVRDIEEGRLDFLYVSPERLKLPRFRSFLKSVDVALFAIDEAHCVSQWGHDFRSSFRDIGTVLSDFSGVPRVALTATADPVTQADILLSLGMQEARQVQSSFSRPNLSVGVTRVEADVFPPLADFLKSYAGCCGIIYRASRKDVDATVLELIGRGMNAVGYHAGMPAEDRARAQERFLEEDDIIVVATIAFGMGIDRGDVRFVVHLDPPATLEGYYQEIGRAGRDGEPSTAMMILHDKALGKQRQKIEANQDLPDERRAVLRSKLENMTAFIETPGCRMQTLLAYFGETDTPACGNCDHCKRPPLTRDGGAQARTVISAVLEVGERFGTATLARILSPGPGGDAEDHVAELDCFGAGRDLSQDVWKLIMRQMIGSGLLAIQPERFGALRATREGRRVLLDNKMPVRLSGTWYAIAPQIEIEEYAAPSEGQRDRLPEGLKETFTELRDRLAPEIESGEIHERDIVRILEARPETTADVAQVSDHPAILKIAGEITSKFAPDRSEELSFGIEI
ncbi:RecQ family ATP-dependent DNA helicase [Salipiger mucosus]|uniref:ATP-dependent DNA helicase RecQ n=1 Tax=Salipiger mucosus DSM 16094 TaxID=1123237 RepID=S9QWM1_9RHOB|nr:RecQ family ATP-dependent DNA helicase [Salipiger mucosus]EPX83982.1 ATP-dependent DNA helicase RecQ [Salipiger mucosus DSM 16094]